MRSDHPAILPLIYLAAAVGGWIMWSIGAPLPWMIGPLIATAAIYVAGLSTYVIPVKTRPVGQIIVAAQVGLFFSPEAFGKLLELSPLLIGMAVATAFCACLTAWVLSRISGMALVPAFLSTIPTSPVEASVIAERLALPAGPVIFAQTLRIASIVVLVPIAIYAIDGWPDRSAPLATGPFEPLRTLILFGAAVGVAMAFRALRISNPFFLGALAASAGMTAAGVTPAPFPAVILSMAQILLGTWLGSTFRRSLFVSAGRTVGAIAVSTLLFVMLSTACGLIASQLLNLHWEDMVLGAAPGGVTEMALTAKFMDLDVALITAFHLVRIFLIVPFIPTLGRWMHRLEGRGSRT
ncbi:AbrB family transcriptional regulator [Paracoccus sp. SM22M-07]|uniref:AbrB family transcriptional regulator n=1 Tax=Paracoccus sp. SM22M-07 TaxID=1520813 RepID=UPI0009307757|nr:AbrB family transcriptional regulator [Paracoccus sp. SM22M-07]